MKFLEPPYKLAIRTLEGIEDVLLQELDEFPHIHKTVSKRAVLVEGVDLATLYMLNLSLRTAIRIMLPIKEFRADNQEDLYKAAYQIPWHDIIPLDKSFAVHQTVKSQHFTNGLFVLQRVKDAIADRITQEKGRRPNVDKDNPNILIDIRISDDNCAISLDTSGQALFKRGYRQSRGFAPINEVLAAGILLKTKWNQSDTLFDPMCGSGTFLIEAAMIASHQAPNLNRKEFGFAHLPNYDRQTFVNVLFALRDEVVQPNCKIVGADNYNRAVQDAMENVKNAGFEKLIQLQRADFFKDVPDRSLFPLHLICNPPYDERLKIEDIELFYKEMGDVLKQHYKGSKAFIMSGNIQATKNIGLRPFLKASLVNGSISSKLLGYELFEGRRKDFLEQQKN